MRREIRVTCELFTPDGKGITETVEHLTFSDETDRGFLGDIEATLDRFEALAEEEEPEEPEDPHTASHPYRLAVVHALDTLEALGYRATYWQHEEDGGPADGLTRRQLLAELLATDLSQVVMEKRSTTKKIGITGRPTTGTPRPSRITLQFILGNHPSETVADALTSGPDAEDDLDRVFDAMAEAFPF